MGVTILQPFATEVEPCPKEATDADNTRILRSGVTLTLLLARLVLKLLPTSVCNTRVFGIRPRYVIHLGSISLCEDVMKNS